MHVELRPLGDSGLLVELPEEISPEVHQVCIALTDAIRREWQGAGPGRLLELVPTYRSLAVYFDPDLTDPSDVHAFVARVASGVSAELGRSRAAPGQRWRVPVVYGGDYGPDLPYVADALGLTEPEVVRLHSQAVYRLYMYGFAPGHASLAQNPPELRMGRRSEPRAAVDAGSVGIGGQQCGIYSLKGPGGLHIIGQTAVRLFSPERVPPTPIAVGDAVQFYPVESLDAAGQFQT